MEILIKEYNILLDNISIIDKEIKEYKDFYQILLHQRISYGAKKIYKYNQIIRLYKELYNDNICDFIIFMKKKYNIESNPIDLTYFSFIR